MKLPYTCGICSKSLSSNSALVQHSRTHYIVKPWNCPQCQRGFSQKSKFEEHLSRHRGVYPFTCHLCRKGFFQKDRLKTHTMTHSGERPFLCECGLSFRRKFELNKHSKMHNTGEKEKTMRHQCVLCVKKCCSPADLKKHMVKHSTERPFHCEFCPKAFKDKYTLGNHEVMAHYPDNR